MRPSSWSASRRLLTTTSPFGAHDFEVQAKGPEGNYEPAPAVYGWEIGDLTPPVVTINDGPAIATTDTTATFVFSTDDSEAVFQCSLDGAVLTVCESPKTYLPADLALASGSVAGEHTFEVTAIKHHLLVDAIPQLWTWTIEDHTAPETFIVTGPPAEMSLEALEPAMFIFSSNELDAAFECALDPDIIAGPQWSQCAAPPENTAEFDGLLAGAHTLLVRAIDPSLNFDATPESYTWTVVGPPTTTISGPPAVTDSTSATITFSANQPNVTFLCEFDGVPVADCASPVELTGLLEGDHSFEVAGTNAYGLVEDPPAALDWMITPPVDTTAPQTTIDSGPPATTVSTTATFTFSGTDAMTPPEELSFECSIDGAAFSGCDSPLELTDVAVGPHTFAVQATDIAGNTDGTPATYSWTVEATPPAEHSCRPQRRDRPGSAGRRGFGIPDVHRGHRRGHDHGRGPD